MKKIFLAVIWMLVLSTATHAQIRHILINVSGEYQIVVEVGPQQYVTVSGDGYLTDIDIPGAVEYNTQFSTSDSQFKSKLKKVGAIDFEYYTLLNSQDGQEYGKIKRIGNIDFKYHYNGYHSGKGREGQLSKVGDLVIYYHNNYDLNECKIGKVKSIGSVSFDFFVEDDFVDPESARKTGLLRTVLTTQYNYTFPLGGRTGGGNSGTERRIIVSGPFVPKAGGITVAVKNGQ